jgi:hypothetical protein
VTAPLKGKFWDDLRALPKDCACAIHDGPHFVHYQEIQHALNMEILDRGGKFAVMACAQAELRRFSELRSELIRRRIITAEEWPQDEHG